MSLLVNKKMTITKRSAHWFMVVDPSSSTHYSQEVPTFSDPINTPHKCIATRYMSQGSSFMATAQGVAIGTGATVSYDPRTIIRNVELKEYDFEIDFRNVTPSHTTFPFKHIHYLHQLINFNFDLKKPIPVELTFEEGECIGVIKELNIYSFATDQYEVLREINEDVTDLFNDLLSHDIEELGKKPKKWLRVLKRYIDAN